MKRGLEVAPEVLEFLRRLAPEPRRRVRRAISGLQHGLGGVKELEGDLVGFYRVTAGSHRVIFTIRVERGTEFVRCIFAEHRSVVYDLFTARLLSED